MHSLNQSLRVVMCSRTAAESRDENEPGKSRLGLSKANGSARGRSEPRAEQNLDRREPVREAARFFPIILQSFLIAGYNLIIRKIYAKISLVLFNLVSKFRLPQIFSTIAVYVSSYFKAICSVLGELFSSELAMLEFLSLLKMILCEICSDHL